MSENSIREALPRFRRGYPVAKVENVNRGEEGRLPSLMEDVRATNLVEYQPPESDITVYLKAVGSPYAGEHGVHFLTIPDRSDHGNISGITNLSPQDLREILMFVESVSRHAFNQPEINEVDFGWHHSRGELKGIPKQRMATFPQNLHIHTIAFSREDMKPMGREELMASADLTGKTGEALHVLGEELFFGEVVPAIEEEYPAFKELFEETKDSRGRKRFRMMQGRGSFAHPELAHILQVIDTKGKAVYDEIAKCFFEYDEEKEQFVEKDDQYARFKLLPRKNRIAKVNKYVEDRPWLTDGVKLGLHWLAYLAQDENAIIAREIEVAKQKKGAELTDSEIAQATTVAANRHWAYKDFVYSMSFSAKKTDEGKDPEWIFAFDPKIFSVEGVVQSSAFTDKLIVRDTNKAYSPQQLKNTQERERGVIEKVLIENPNYQIGPGINLNA